jgi:hypothetical protein
VREDAISRQERSMGHAYRAREKAACGDFVVGEVEGGEALKRPDAAGQFFEQILAQVEAKVIRG